MKFLKWLLFPFALLYGGIMALRNFCYDRGIFETTRFGLPVISVGNLTVGGTGKTPHVEFLLRLLKDRKVATLSRGYKRKSTGFLLANPTVSAETLGDEPFQYYLDFPEVTVAVCEKRVAGIQKIQELKPDTEVIILDDAFQHRAVSPSLNLLITDFYRRFDTDFMLPTGLLREPRSGAARADAVIVSKCPEEISEAQQSEIKIRISKYTKPGTPVFFTSYKYAEMVGFGSQKVATKNVILVTGIANPEPLKNYLLSAGYQIQEHLNWPDHHAYAASDLKRITNAREKFKTSDPIILTTRKDAVKLLSAELAAGVQQLPFFYLPVEVFFLADQEIFEKLVIRKVQANVPLF